MKNLLQRTFIAFTFQCGVTVIGLPNYVNIYKEITSRQQQINQKHEYI